MLYVAFHVSKHKECDFCQERVDKILEYGGSHAGVCSKYTPLSEQMGLQKDVAPKRKYVKRDPAVVVNEPQLSSFEQAVAAYNKRASATSAGIKAACSRVINAYLKTNVWFNNQVPVEEWSTHKFEEAAEFYNKRECATSAGVKAVCSRIINRYLKNEDEKED